MKFLRSLCCGSSNHTEPTEPAPRRPDDTNKQPEKAAQKAPEKTIENVAEKAPGKAPQKAVEFEPLEAEPPKLPSPPSHFITHLSQNPQTPAIELLKPYLKYELWLRRTFARGKTQLDSLANLTPVYGKQDEELRIRNIDRRSNDKRKYLLCLPDNHVNPDGAPAIAASLDEYKRNFEAFTHCKSAIY